MGAGCAISDNDARRRAAAGSTQGLRYVIKTGATWPFVSSCAVAGAGTGVPQPASATRAARITHRHRALDSDFISSFSFREHDQKDHCQAGYFPKSILICAKAIVGAVSM